jgi:hypothetical protein
MLVIAPVIGQNGRVRGLFWLLVSWLAAGAAAQAQAAVVLFERAPLRPALCAALRIQLSGSAEVRCVTEGAAAGLAERLQTARARLRSDDAKLGVLLERDTDPRLVRMYLVGAEGEQASLAIERIEDRPEPDVDRSLALKVRDAYEVIGFVERELPKSEAAAAVLAVPRSTVAVAAAAPVAGPAAVPEPYVHAFVELGGGLALGGALRGLGSALIGVGAVSTRARYELGLGARLFLSRESAREGATRVSLTERGPLLAARVLFRTGRLELGAALQLYLAVISAEAVGIRKPPLLTPVIGLGPDLRVRLFPLAYLRFAPGLELATVRRQYTVYERPTPWVPRGHVGASLVLALVISLPVQPTSQGFQP